MNLIDVGSEGVDWSHVAQNRGGLFKWHRNFGFYKRWEISRPLRVHQFIEKDSPPCLVEQLFNNLLLA
jgi:hypothetical protein